MNWFSRVLSSPGEVATSTFGRGPLVVTFVQPGREFHVLGGPPWEAESEVQGKLSGDTFRGQFFVGPDQAIVVPDDGLPCLISGFALDASESEQIDSEESRWKKWRRDK